MAKRAFISHITEEADVAAKLKGALTRDFLQMLVIRKFCLDKQTSIFFIPERVIQEVELARELIFRLLDYRIIHSVGAAFTHKSVQGSFQGFMIDVGSYAFMRKLAGKMTEIDLSSPQAKETMRSVPILSEELLINFWDSAPKQIDVKTHLLTEAES